MPCSKAIVPVFLTPRAEPHLHPAVLWPLMVSAFDYEKKEELGPTQIPQDPFYQFGMPIPQPLQVMLLTGHILMVLKYSHLPLFD